MPDLAKLAGMLAASRPPDPHVQQWTDYKAAQYARTGAPPAQVQAWTDAERQRYQQFMDHQVAQRAIGTGVDKAVDALVRYLNVAPVPKPQLNEFGIAPTGE